MVFPVNFALLKGDVVFRTVEGTKFHEAAAGAVVAFEADGYEPDGSGGWSVLVQGVSRVITEPSELRRARQLNVEPWAIDGTADRVVRITARSSAGVGSSAPPLVSSGTSCPRMASPRSWLRPLGACGGNMAIDRGRIRLPSGDKSSVEPTSRNFSERPGPPVRLPMTS